MSEISFRRSLQVFLFCVLAIAAGHSGFAQPGDSPTAGGDLEKILGGKEASKQFSSNTEGEQIPIERRVNAAFYYVGPNDQILVSASGLTEPIPVVVGLDNTLVIPRFQPIDVDGLTLAGLEKRVDSIFKSRSGMYGNVRLSLLASRSVYVNVSGNVIAPGRYILSSADRVTTAIDLANKVPEELATVDDQFLELSKQSVLGNKSQYGSRNLGSEPKAQVRHVVVRHASGGTSTADLLRYRAFGNDEDNPTLREGDNVIVSFADPFGPKFSAVGAVNNPVIGLPYEEGDNLKLLLSLAAGVRGDAQLGAAYIVRSSDKGEQEIPVDLSNQALVESFLLEPGDQLIVPGKLRKTTAHAGVVTVEGEVVRPQAYSIVSGETTLSQLIDRAGGFTPFASLNGAYIRRPDDPLSLRPQQLVLDPKSGIATSPLSLEDTTRFIFDQQLQRNMVSADFTAIFVDKDASRDVVLQNGDEVIVPRELGQVYVQGRVKHPGWVAYKRGEAYEYYIAQAGGYTAAAAPDRIAVEKFGTGIWDSYKTDIESGDKIYVPGERDTPARTVLEQTSTILLIVSSALGIIQAVLGIINFFENR